MNIHGDVSLTGSSVYESHELLLDQIESVTTFSGNVNRVLIMNDQVDDIRAAFGGNASYTLYDSSDEKWTFTGGWTNNTSYFRYGSNAKFSTTTNDTAVLNPANAIITALTFATVKGFNAGIAKIEVSTDNGATWKDPSTITGITRSDGASGVGLNTFDSYAATAGTFNLTYKFPYPANWVIRITVTGTKNASSGGFQIWVDAALTNNAKCIRIKAGENLDLPLRTASVSLFAESGTPLIRVVGL